MSKKESAFNGEFSYRQLAEQGRNMVTAGDKEKIKHYINLMKSDDSVSVQRASAIISNASDVNAHLFAEFVPDFLEILENNVHRSAPRAVFRILERVQSIPEDWLGPLIDISFRYLNDSEKSIAEKVFAMTVIANQIENYPDLKHELGATLSAQMQTGSAGFKSRARKIAAKYGIDL